jgi:hypothetical protein
VFDGGAVSVPILATESFSGRTTSDTLVASTEIGIADFIAKNGGIAAGSLKNELADTWSLRLSLPMTEADLMAAHRTSFDNFKWTYNLQLTTNNKQLTIKSLGTVAEPIANVTVLGDTLTIALSCATEGASVFYSFDGAPQLPYSAPITVDIANRDLAANPVTFYLTAVKEGYDDAGIITAKYPGLAPAFKTLYSGMSNAPLTFEAADGVSASEWSVWAAALTFVTLKAPSVNGYVRVDAAKYKVDNTAKSVTFDSSLFADTGSYSFVFHAAGYADKSVSLTLKKPAPTVTTATPLTIGRGMRFTFNEAEFAGGASLYVTPPNGESVMISSSWLDRSKEGSLTLKAAYFASPSCVVVEPGVYTFAFVNSRFEPGTIELTADVAAGLVVRFDDVSPSDWYYEAVMYAVDEGLLGVFGGAERSFGANVPVTHSEIGLDGEGGVTREDFATVLFAFAEPGYAVGDLSHFSDNGNISPQARDAMAWAVGANIINGYGNGKLEPKSVVTRAQVAQILYNLAQ